MKILIIEDSCEVRDVLRLIIEKHNHEVVEAVDGQDGLEKAKAHHPDLIIMDALMPRVDGFTLLRNIKNDPSLSTIPCVFLSAIYTNNTDRKLALSLGAAVFIAKPFDVETFWKEVEPILEREKQPFTRMVEDEKEFLKSYNQTFVAKLEEKVKELEEGTLVLGVIRDITERKRMEGEIKRLFAAIDQSVNVVFISDAKGNIEYVNAMFEQVTGYSGEEVIGRNPSMLSSGETTRAEYAELWETITEEIMRILREYGVDYAQGYFIGKPAPDIAGMRIG